MKRLALPISLFLASPAFANMPPKEFDHAPTVKVIKHRVAYGQAFAMCDKIYMRRFGLHYPNPPRYGCTIKDRDGNNPEVVYSYDPTGKDPKMADNSLRHEIGHVNGWPKNHPNALP